MIDLSAGTISMVGVLGPLCNTFTGRCRFEADPATGGYKMVYGWVGVGGSVCVLVWLGGSVRRGWGLDVLEGQLACRMKRFW